MSKPRARAITALVSLLLLSVGFAGSAAADTKPSSGGDTVSTTLGEILNGRDIDDVKVVKDADRQKPPSVVKQGSSPVKTKGILDCFRKYNVGKACIYEESTWFRVKVKDMETNFQNVYALWFYDGGDGSRPNILIDEHGTRDGWERWIGSGNVIRYWICQGDIADHDQCWPLNGDGT